MTTAAPGASIPVWDTSPLFHAIKADRIDLLADFARERQGTLCRNVTTATVVDELVYANLDISGLGWLEKVHVDGLDELGALVRWMEVVSGERSNHGEATVLAWAEVHGATAVIDDADARRAAQKHGMPVQGSLRVLADALREGRITEYPANAFADAMVDTGARYPFGSGGFLPWVRRMKLL
ncbi:hypothetical protein OU787_17760 [Kitasatospora sp. YST-16]|uniref:hypothetical protein n=1 Tax=Kitasatospora sp. YST-16 TaxID=2998080 RepID=UPI0022847DF3|nr:hypothetical protein [Kitasatospora sp. YST-16]WAL73193.1 hypothetical protein OU787_17760 [Kitasatospora sp. YST-16]WNW39246.1 hypothetical protein RKE32_17720 [Streptomyces sp. Li-HN-5-13]